MQTQRTLTLGFFVATMMAMGAGPAQAQTTSNGPYYAEPAWDQKLQCDTEATCPRFIVLLNWSSAAVLDRETGLVWERSPGGDFDNDGDVDINDKTTWGTARIHCADKAVGGRKGWRLPSFAELASLVDPNNVDTEDPIAPALPPGHPFQNVQSSFYWSASTNAGNAATAWLVHFGDGNVTTSGKTNSFFVWCVRAGMNADAY